MTITLYRTPTGDMLAAEQDGQIVALTPRDGISREDMLAALAAGDDCHVSDHMLDEPVAGDAWRRRNHAVALA